MSQSDRLLLAMLFLLVAWLSLASATAEADDYLGPRLAAPAPTAAPEEWLVHLRLQPRAVGGNTCGWINGVASSVLTCDTNAQCASNSLLFGCCTGNLNDCRLPSACFDSTMVAAFGSYGGSQFGVLSCTDAASPSCQTYLKSTAYALNCGAVGGSFSVSNTIGGGASVAGVTLSSARIVASGTIASGAGGLGAGASAAPSSAVTSTGAVAAGSQGTTNGNGGSALSTGAIIAIAVCGGIVAIALICLVAFCVYRRKRRNQPSVAYVPPPQGAAPQNPPPQNFQQQPQQDAGGGAVSIVGSHTLSQSMTQSDLNPMMPGQQPGEWDFAKPGVGPQHARTGEYDGIAVTEIMPDEAVDERRRQDMVSRVGSNVAPTAVAPTILSHHVQGV